MTSCTKLGVALALLALLVAGRAQVPLNPGLYDNAAACTSLAAGETCAQHCLQLAFNTVYNQIRNPANCLRLAFHDAGTFNKTANKWGANGSILQALELAAPVNAGLGVCAPTVQPLVNAIRAAGCPITKADAIQVMALASVSLTGGPVCPLLMGRPDTNVADSPNALPSQCENAAELKASFAVGGLVDPELSLVVLSGAHSIGQSRATPRSTCSKGLGPLTQTPNAFDGHYYVEVVKKVGKAGWFFSDRTLNDPTTGASSRMVSLMQGFAANPASWASAGATSPWCVAFQEMGLMGVDPAPLTLTSGTIPTVPTNNGNGGGRAPVPVPVPAPVPVPVPVPVPIPAPAKGGGGNGPAPRKGGGGGGGGAGGGGGKGRRALLTKPKCPFAV